MVAARQRRRGGVVGVALGVQLRREGVRAPRSLRARPATLPPARDAANLRRRTAHGRPGVVGIIRPRLRQSRLPVALWRVLFAARSVAVLGVLVAGPASGDLVQGVSTFLHRCRMQVGKGTKVVGIPGIVGVRQLLRFRSRFRFRLRLRLRLVALGVLLLARIEFAADRLHWRLVEQSLLGILLGVVAVAPIVEGRARPKIAGVRVSLLSVAHHERFDGGAAGIIGRELAQCRLSHLGGFKPGGLAPGLRLHVVDRRGRHVGLVVVELVVESIETEAVVRVQIVVVAGVLLDLGHGVVVIAVVGVLVLLAALAGAGVARWAGGVTPLRATAAVFLGCGWRENVAPAIVVVALMRRVRVA